MSHSTQWVDYNPIQQNKPCFIIFFQETYYNLGRSMQQLGLFPAAVHYYKKALATKPIFKNDKIFDLSQEAAFNLSLIYQSSGSHEMARLYQQQYIVI